MARLNGARLTVMDMVTRVSTNDVSVRASIKSLQKAIVDQRLAKEFPDANFETHLVKGDPADVTSRFVKDEGINLLVMGTVARTGVPGFFIGNTAEEILHAINCSVLSIKPEDFVAILR